MSEHSPAGEDGEQRPDRVSRELSVEERIRRELARELHDQVAQPLLTMLVKLELFRNDQYGRAGVQREIDFFSSSTRRTLHNIRQVLHDLRDESDLHVRFSAALQEQLLEPFQVRTGIQVHLRVGRDWPVRLNPPAAVNLFRIIQETLRNVHRHSEALNVHIRLMTLAGSALVAIRDDGRGIETGEDEVGHGLLGIRERALVLDGTVSVRARPQRGTALLLQVPLVQVAP